jgi:16S rRNA (guanine966-N2)-methyltransferase
MKVIAGEYRGRILKTLPGLDVRPTPSRLRETLFDILGESVRGSIFIDAYAGSGAVGIEALSRAAASVVFLEANELAARCIQDNLAGLRIVKNFKSIRLPARKALIKLSSEGMRANILFADPPYDAHHEYAHLLEWISENNVLAPGGIVVVQHSKRDEIAEQCGSFHRYRLLTQGSNALSFYRVNPTE